MVIKSRYTDREVSEAQFLTEWVCERIAAHKKLGELPQQFWKLPFWKKTFQVQILHANRLLKLYTLWAIIRVLRRNTNVYSLGANWLAKQFEAEQNKQDKQIIIEQEYYEKNKPIEEVIFRQNKGGAPSLRSKLE